MTAQIDAAPVRSSYENATRSLSRDIGISVVLPDGHDMWLFGDTSVYTLTSTGSWANTGFVDGSTALEGRYTRGQVPSGAETPLHWPSRFVPVPNNVYLPDGSGRRCVKGIADAAFSARWPTGAVVLASNHSEVLVTYNEVCVTEPPGGRATATSEGWGYMLYNWRERRIALGPIDVFHPTTNGAPLAPSHVFGSPIYLQGQLTMFSSSCGTEYLVCGNGHVWSVSTSKLGDPTSYRPKPLSTDGTAAWQPFTISVGQYGHALRLIESTTIGGGYKLFGTSTLGLPWHLIRTGTLPNCAPSSIGYCLGFEGHPELSTPTQIFVSYKDPNSGPGGHMVISAINQ